MQKSLTLQKTRYEDDFKTCETSGGLFDFSACVCVELKGADAKDYLQRMSTVDFRNLQPGDIRRGAFLTGRGTVVSLGWFHYMGETVHYFVPLGQRDIAMEHIEKFHFAERFTTTDKTDDWALFGLWGKALPILPKSALIFQSPRMAAPIPVLANRLSLPNGNS